MRTPVRAVWPLPPRPPVLPFRDPMPRPTRMRPWRAPALSEISLSFMAHFLYGARASRPLLPSKERMRAGRPRSLPFLNHAHEMRDLGDHAPRRRRVLQFADATDTIESEADEGLALVVAAPVPAADLLALYGLPGGRHGEPP